MLKFLVKRSYRHADQVQYQLNKLNEMVYHPFKPVAHLSGSRYLDASPSPTGLFKFTSCNSTKTIF